MTFESAARVQYRFKTYYAILAVGPNGERVTCGSTQQKSGRGLLKALGNPAILANIRAAVPNPDGTEIVKKTATALHLSNGWRIEFGGTIRQEAN